MLGIARILGNVLYGVQSEPHTNAGQTYAMYRTPNNMVPDDELGQPGAEVVGIPPIIGPGGERGGRAYSAIAGVGNYKFYANASVSDAKLKKMLEMLDFYMGTLEGWINFRNGKEGVHFDWDREPFDSFARERKESELPEGAGHGRVSVYPVFYTLDRLKIIAPRPLADFQSSYALVDGGINVYTTRSHRADFRTETDFEEAAPTLHVHPEHDVERVLLQGHNRSDRRRRRVGRLRPGVERCRRCRHRRRARQGAYRRRVSPGTVGLLRSSRITIRSRPDLPRE